ncbi:ESPR-type extended signal peptide-containing protein, partial [Pasteurella atlantica]
MNNIYKIVFNQTTQTYTAVSELAKGAKKSQTQSSVFRPQSSEQQAGTFLPKFAKVTVAILIALGFSTSAIAVSDAEFNALKARLDKLETANGTVASNGVTIGGRNGHALGHDSIIVGGGNGSGIDGTGRNKVTAENSAILGGAGNTVEGYDSAVIAGHGNIVKGVRAVAMGHRSVVSGDEAFAIGDRVIASGMHSMATGYRTEATTDSARAMGVRTEAKGYGSTTMGLKSLAVGTGSLATGGQKSPLSSKGKGVYHYINAKDYDGMLADYSDAFTTEDRAKIAAITDDFEKAKFMETKIYEHAGALGGRAYADGSMALGTMTVAGKEVKSYQEVENEFVRAEAKKLGLSAEETEKLFDRGASINAIAQAQLNAEGKEVSSENVEERVLQLDAKVREMDKPNEALREIEAVAMGYRSKATEDKSIALGFDTNAGGRRSIAIGTEAIAAEYGSINISTSGTSTVGDGGTVIGGRNGHALGHDSIIVGGGNGSGIDGTGRNKVTAENSAILGGAGNTVEGYDSAVIAGHGNIVKGIRAVAMGNKSVVSGDEAFAIGDRVIASGMHSMATGYRTEAVGGSSFSVNARTKAIGGDSSAFGYASRAVGKGSFAAGGKSLGEPYVAGGKNIYYYFNNEDFEGLKQAYSDVFTTDVAAQLDALESIAEKEDFAEAKILESRGVRGGVAYADGSIALGTGTVAGKKVLSEGEVSRAVLAKRAREKGLTLDYKDRYESGINSLVEKELLLEGKELTPENRTEKEKELVLLTDAAQAPYKKTRELEAVAMGYRSKATEDKSIALGFDAKAEHENSVALGSKAETRAFTQEDSATVNGLKYKDFTGFADGVVSVG